MTSPCRPRAPDDGRLPRVNRHLYAGDWRGSRVTWLEGLYYLRAIASVYTGWYFNVTYVLTYPSEASWVHFTEMLFTKALDTATRAPAQSAA